MRSYEIKRKIRENMNKYWQMKENPIEKGAYWGSKS